MSDSKEVKLRLGLKMSQLETPLIKYENVGYDGLYERKCPEQSGRRSC